MKTSNRIIIITLAVLSLGFLSFVVLKRKKPKTILLLGGLDNRSGDKDLDEQIDLLQQGLGKEINVVGFRYNDLAGISQQIENSKQPVGVVLFSAGGRQAKNIAQGLLRKGFSLNNMYVVEPYALSENTTSSVRGAVMMGMPEKNVLVGTSKGTGQGIVEQPTNTPTCSPRHWCSLTMVGQIISK